jgi:hypothetical protein
MTYEKEDLINEDAYLPGEQGGVSHLIHGRIQQGQRKKVIRQITLP